jgi:hypothetical protein
MQLTAYNYTDSQKKKKKKKIYWQIRCTKKDSVNLLYNFIGINGIINSSSSQMTEVDLVLVYLEW